MHRRRRRRRRSPCVEGQRVPTNNKQERGERDVGSGCCQEDKDIFGAVTRCVCCVCVYVCRFPSVRVSQGRPGQALSWPSQPLTLQSLLRACGRRLAKSLGAPADSRQESKIDWLQSALGAGRPAELCLKHQVSAHDRGWLSARLELSEQPLLAATWLVAAGVSG